MQKIAIIIFIAFLYAIGGLLSQYLAIEGTVISPIWPPAGIALAAILIFDNTALIGIFLGCFIVDYWFSGGILPTLLNAAAPSAGATLQAYVGKLGLKRICNTYNIFYNTRSIITFIFISAFTACLINASIGTTTLMLTRNILINDLPYYWLVWWIADAAGVISIASIIIAWHQYWHEHITIEQIFKLIATWILILIIGYLTFYYKIQFTFQYIPFAILAAFQFRIQYALLTGLLISSICLYGAAAGYTILYVNSTTSIILIQLFISIIYLTILLIHTILAARETAYKELQTLNAQLEQRVLDRTKELSESNQQLAIQKNKAIEAYEALKQSHTRLMQSEKMASLGLLTAGVAHEIKNPLNAMTANIATIKANVDHLVQFIGQSQTDATVRKNIQHINETTNSLIVATNEGIKRTSGVIADLCAFARADEPIMTKIDLHRNIDTTLNLLGSEIQKNITLIKDYGDIPLLPCHPGKINQVIMNILVNAIHALQSRPNSKITISTKYVNGAIVLSIKDNGAGIPKEILDKIWKPFFTTKTSGSGSGLGLFISYNIIKEHHGTLTVTSELNEGTEFIITLPIDKNRT